MRSRITALTAAAFCALTALVVTASQTHTAAQAPLPAITVGPAVPPDIPSGAPAAKLTAAAAFAWQEFIALNWPAVAQTGAAGQRDTPDTTCVFDDPKCVTRPRVWETFRSKLEVFPGNFQPPPGYSKTAPDFGYDALPVYNYAVTVPACGMQSPQPTAWVNLDESDQITVDAMYAGAGPTSVQGNSDPQLIRFLAKANRTEYGYVAQNAFWTAIPIGIRTATTNYLAAHNADPTPAPAGTTASTVSLPYQTIEMKAGWRVLTAKELGSGRFHTATARFYEFGKPTKSGAKTYCWRQATWGLVALHVIQKTQSAPYFIYATFEQADNITTPSGASVENDDGSIAVAPACRLGQAVPCPTTPLEVLVDGPTPMPSSAFPPNIVLATPPASQAYCTPSLRVRPKNQLYYLNEGAAGAQPANGFICVNSRVHPIPPAIVAVNRVAQSAIRTYEKANGFATPSPLSHYKLVNVQYVPYDNPQPGQFGGNDPTTGNNPASFYLANIVVETNRSLQKFNGGLINNLVEAQYAGRFAAPPTIVPGNPTHKQTLYAGHANNMGGCMGCHGSQGQSQGGNFSVILARGGLGNMNPEPPAPIGATALRAIPRNRLLVSH